MPDRLDPWTRPLEDMLPLSTPVASRKKRPCPPPSERQQEFLRFCSRALGTGRIHPLRLASGIAPAALVSAMVEAFRELEPRPPEPARPTVVETYEGPQWREPFTVYAIRNTVTGSTYIGRAKNGFTKRYALGRWWEDHHNRRLRADVELYGVLSFRVSLWQCPDEPEMIRLEAELIRAHRTWTYNAKPEPEPAA